MPVSRECKVPSPTKCNSNTKFEFGRSMGTNLIVKKFHSKFGLSHQLDGQILFSIASEGYETNSHIKLGINKKKQNM